VAGLDPDVRSVGSVFVSRWDVAVAPHVPAPLKNQLGNAIAGTIYTAARELHASPRWQRAQNAGARPQRVLWASTGTKDPDASDILYVKALAAPYTVNTIPEKTLLAFADHGALGAPLAVDSHDAEAVIAHHREAGVDIDAVAATLQTDGASSFVKSWHALLARIAQKTATSG